MVGIMNLGIELAGRMEAAIVIGLSLALSTGGRRCSLHHVAVDDLRHADMSTVGHEIECLCLNTGGCHRLPF